MKLQRRGGLNDEAVVQSVKAESQSSVVSYVEIGTHRWQTR